MNYTQRLLDLCRDEWPGLHWRVCFPLVVHARDTKQGLDVTVWRAIHGQRATGYVRLRPAGATEDVTWMEVAETTVGRRPMLRRLRAKLASSLS